MATYDLVKLFDQTKIRVVWDDEKEKYYFAVMDLVQVLTEQPDRRTAAKYWSVVKTRLKQEGVELPTICSQLKLQAADGKYSIKRISKKSAAALFLCELFAYIKKKQYFCSGF